VDTSALPLGLLGGAAAPRVAAALRRQPGAGAPAQPRAVVAEVPARLRVAVAAVWAALPPASWDEPPWSEAVSVEWLDQGWAIGHR
jgi:hypothetical protein